MENIIWLPVVGFVGYYEVDNFGHIRSVSNMNRYRPNQKPTTLRHHVSKFGYAQVTLTKNGSRHLKRVNRIVAESFIQNTHNKPCVNHKNGIKTDNYVDNLEWVTYSENERHSIETLGKCTKGVKRTFKNGINKRSKPLFCNENNTRYDSIKDAANALKLARANITAQINGRLTRTGGYTFHFCL